MELEGTLEVERPKSRRWVPVVAVAVPVIAFVILAAWFIRVFVAPPMVAIPLPAMPPADQIAARSELPEPRQASAVAPGAASDARSVYTPGVSMLSSVTSVPPMLASASSTISMPAMAAPAAAPMVAPVAAPMAAAAEAPMAAPQPTTTASASAWPPAVTLDPAQDAQAALEPSEPIQGPIPLPAKRPKPHTTVAHASLGPVPLPRPRPAEAAARPEPEAALTDRHNVQ